jgi:hypothetical protein
VSLAADVASALPELRAAAESLHLDTFTVYRPAGFGPDPDEPLREIPVFATVHTGVRGKFQTGQAQARETETPGVKVAETSLQWHTSVSVTGVLTDDVVECTASADPSLVNVRARIVGPFVKSIATARRFQVEITS